MFEPANYGPVVRQLLESTDKGFRLLPLAPPEPLQGEALESLRRAHGADLFQGAEVSSPDFAACARSALFLYFSALDESHRISQDIKSATGSFLHGVMHRQEPDYSNAKYWFRQTGKHELFPTLREDVLRLQLFDRSLREQIERSREWDPFWFVDKVEDAVRSRSSELTDDLRSIQRLEWQLLFDYCYRRALSG